MVFVVSCCFLDLYLQAGGIFQRVLYSLFIMFLMPPLKFLNFGKSSVDFFFNESKLFSLICVCIKIEIAESLVSFSCSDLMLLDEAVSENQYEHPAGCPCGRSHCAVWCSW